LTGTYNDHPIGVFYYGAVEKWAVFNQDDTSSMPVGAAFNVVIPEIDSRVFIHRATAGNTDGHRTYINHSLTNKNPHAFVFVTQNWNPGGKGGTYNDHPIGVYYNHVAEKWAIFNQDHVSSMPEGASFNILVRAGKVYLPIVVR
jgi:hypothetical protein